MFDIRYFLPLLFLSVTASTGHSQTARGNNELTHTVTAAYMEGCETGQGSCTPVTLTRKPGETVLLNFPAGGTYSDVYLYAQEAYLHWINHTQSKPEVLLHDGRSYAEGFPRLNLSSLPDGTYRCHMMACGLGGFFDLTLLTENKQ